MTVQPPVSESSRGFTLVELMVAMTIMLVVSGSSLALLAAYQRSYGSTVLRSNLRTGLRSAADLLIQEVAQAGLLSFTPRTLSAGVTASPLAQSVGVASTAGIFVGEKLLIDRGASQETVAVTAVGSTTVSGVFTRSHASGAMVRAVGVFPQGVLSSSSSTQLKLFGDINGDGTLVYVRYDCSVANGTLGRSVTPVTAGSASPVVVLVDNVIANPGGTPCFRYVSTTIGSYTFVTSVSLTLTARSASVDPVTGQRRSETKSFRAMVPRNVLQGVAFAAAGVAERLQPTPPGVPLS